MSNLTLVNCDTDSISACKRDQSFFPKEEQDEFISNINSVMPEHIQYSHDGYYHKVIVLMSKNYILYDGKKITYKGSAIKAKGKAPALQVMIKDFVSVLLHSEEHEYQEKLTLLYNTIAKEINNITDVTRWCSRKTISATTLSSERTNETKIVDAISGTDYVEGDRIYTYFKEDGSLGLLEHFDGKYDKMKLFEDLYKTTLMFDSILPVKDWFINYKLKKNHDKIKYIC